MKSIIKKENLILQGLVIIMCLLPVFLCDVSLIVSVSFYLTQLFILLIPGIAIVKLTGIKINSFIELTVYSYVAGIALAFVNYFFTMLIGIKLVALITGIVYSAISIYYLYKNKKEFNFDNNAIENTGFFIILFACYIFCFLTVSYRNVLPSNAESGYNTDLLYWIGNNIALSKNFRPENYRMVGSGKYYYHYFSSMLVAVLSFISHAEVFTVSVDYSYVISCILMVGGSYVLLKRLVKNPYLLFIGSFLILFTEGSASFLTDHIIINPFGFDYGYGIGMLAVSHLIMMEQENEYNFRNLIISCLLIILTTGMKGPEGLVILMAFGICAFIKLFTNFKTGALFGLSWLFSFVFTYFFFITNIFGPSTNNGLEFYGILKAFDNNFWAMTILNELRNTGFPDNGLTRIIALFLYVFRSNIPSMVCFLIASLFFVYELLIKHGFNHLVLSLLMVGLWGIMLTINTWQDGNSQMYFIMSTFPYGIASGFYYIDKTLNSKMIGVVLLIIVGIFSYTNVIRCFNERLIPVINKATGIRNGNNAISIEDQIISMDEYDAALWLKQNSDEDAIAVFDVFKVGEKKKEEVFGIFSERYIWNDCQYENESDIKNRRDVVDSFIKGDKEAYTALKENNVKYLVISLGETEKLNFEYLKIVHENDACCIYEIIW